MRKSRRPLTAPEQHEKDTNTRRPERAWCIRRAVREEPSVAVGQDIRSGGTGYEVLSDTENYGRYSAGLTQLDLCFLKDKGQMGGGASRRPSMPPEHLQRSVPTMHRPAPS